MKIYEITPVTKPRQTRSDKWKKRPCVLRYRAFADHVRLLGIDIESSSTAIGFVLPMPKSWSAKKKARMDGEPHQQTPDIDNLLKALLDACHKDDSFIHHFSSIYKIWGYEGLIVIDGVSDSVYAAHMEIFKRFRDLK